MPCYGIIAIFALFLSIFVLVINWMSVFIYFYLFFFQSVPLASARPVFFRVALICYLES